MRGFIKLAVLSGFACLLAGCHLLPQPKDVDQGKADRAMEQVEKGEGN